MAGLEEGKTIPPVGRNLDSESISNCDKCNQPVRPEDDTALIGAVAFNDSILSRSRHFLSTEICQGSPSRAQYIDGQPRDKRGYPYDERYEPLVRAAYELNRAFYTEDKTLSQEALLFLRNNIGRGMLLIWKEDKKEPKFRNE